MRITRRSAFLAVSLTAANLAAVTLGAVTLGAAPAWAGASDEQAVVDHATGTLQDLTRDKAFGNAQALIRTARAVMIAPRIIKAGFFFGGEGGSAVLCVRGKKGWSYPAFYAIGSASFGLQIGAQQSEMILIIRTDKALKAMLSDKFKIGANAAISVVTLGSSASAASTGNLDADIIAWASSTGAYAGLTLDGSLIQPRADGNAAYYGRTVSPEAIVLKHETKNPGAHALLAKLRTLG